MIRLNIQTQQATLSVPQESPHTLQAQPAVVVHTGGLDYELGVGLKVEESVLMVDSATDFNGDNDRPAAATLVQTQLGNIEAILATI